MPTCALPSVAMARPSAAMLDSQSVKSWKKGGHDRGVSYDAGKKVEGRKSHIEARPDVVKLAKALARTKPKGGKLSLRAISAELAAQGFLNERGRPFNPKSIAAMLAS